MKDVIEWFSNLNWVAISSIGSFGALIFLLVQSIQNGITIRETKEQRKETDEYNRRVLDEMRKDRQEANKPHLHFKAGFLIFYPQRDIYPDYAWLKMNNEISAPQVQEPFSIQMSNVGIGPALDIKVKWDYRRKELETFFMSDASFFYKDGRFSYHLKAEDDNENGSIIHTESVQNFINISEQEYHHLQSNDNRELMIPKPIELYLNTYVYLNKEKKGNMKPLGFNFDVEYHSINGQHFIQNYTLRPQFSLNLGNIYKKRKSISDSRFDGYGVFFIEKREI